MRRKTVASISKMAMAAFALAAVPTIVQAGPKTRTGDSPAKRVCKVTMLTGSRLVERVCKTSEEWDYQEKKAQDSLLQNQIDGPIRPVPDAMQPGVDRKLGGSDG